MLIAVNVRYFRVIVNKKICKNWDKGFGMGIYNMVNNGKQIFISQECNGEG